jgi:hypothetical protein
MIMAQENVVLCASSAYEQKYYLNPVFERLPGQVQEELKIMCVLFTEDVGGILSLEFDEKGNLTFNVTADEGDLLYDDIGSGLKINQIIREKQELLQQLELYYQAFFPSGKLPVS